MSDKFCIAPGEGSLTDYVIRLGIVMSKKGWSASKHQHTKEVRKALNTLNLLRDEDIDTIIPLIAVECTPDEFPPKLKDCTKSLLEGLLREYAKIRTKYSPRMRDTITNMIIDTIHKIASYPKAYENLYDAFLSEFPPKTGQDEHEGGEGI